MAKKKSENSSKKYPKVKVPKVNKIVADSKDDCDGGSCPINKKKKKPVASQTKPVVETKVSQVSLCSRVMAALFFWK